VGGTTKGVALSSLVDGRVFCCASSRSSDVKEYRRMWRMIVNPQKDVSIRRLTTGGATA
jgi:hypothetical protein